MIQFQIKSTANTINIYLIPDIYLFILISTYVLLTGYNRMTELPFLIIKALNIILPTLVEYSTAI